MCIRDRSHTVNHPDLSATDKATQKVELTDSIDFLENKLNTKVNTIAYPSGRYNQTTLDLAKKTYKLGLTTNEGLASAKDGLLLSLIHICHSYSNNCHV